MSSKINVSDAVDVMIEKAAAAAKLSKKEFMESCVMYFISRGLNPKKMKDGEGLAIQNHITKEINRSIGFIIRQEKTLLFNIMKDIAFHDLRQQIFEGNILEIMKVSDEDFEDILKRNRNLFNDKKIKIEERIKKMFEEIGH